MDACEKILSCEGITHRFGGLKALDNVSFSLKKGEVFGIVGPNGAGKTTLFNIISGLIKPTKGTILFRSTNITHLKHYQRAKIGIGRTFQVVRPFSSMSVLENVAVAYGVRFYPKPLGMWRPWKNVETIEKVEQILSLVGLYELKDRLSNELPLGMQRLLEIARALALNPEIVLLDESFSGLSFSEMEELERVIRKVNSKGVSFIVIEHNMPVVMRLCERVMVISYGKKIAEGSPEKVVKNPDVIEAYLGKKHTKSR